MLAKSMYGFHSKSSSFVSGFNVTFIFTDVIRNQFSVPSPSGTIVEGEVLISFEFLVQGGVLVGFEGQVGMTVRETQT
uniref:Uncharacterized protein n=1 Tax=Cannabis sativa TaxID=3483 RepID=A0A803P3V3_CANSA